MNSGQAGVNKHVNTDGNGPNRQGGTSGTTGQGAGNPFMNNRQGVNKNGIMYNTMYGAS